MVVVVGGTAAAGEVFVVVAVVFGVVVFRCHISNQRVQAVHVLVVVIVVFTDVETTPAAQGAERTDC